MGVGTATTRARPVPVVAAVELVVAAVIVVIVVIVAAGGTLAMEGSVVQGRGCVTAVVCLRKIAGPIPRITDGIHLVDCIGNMTLMTLMTLMSLISPMSLVPLVRCRRDHLITIFITITIAIFITVYEHACTHYVPL